MALGGRTKLGKTAETWNLQIFSLTLSQLSDFSDTCAPFMKQSSISEVCPKPFGVWRCLDEDPHVFVMARVTGHGSGLAGPVPEQRLQGRQS